MVKRSRKKLAESAKSHEKVGEPVKANKPAKSGKRGKMMKGSKRFLSRSKKALAAPVEVLAESTKIFQPEDDGVAAEIKDLDVMVHEAPQRVYDAYLLNIDGTVFFGDLVIDGMDKVLEALETMRRPVRFISTSSSTSSSLIATTLSERGYEVAPEHVYTPARLAINFMREHHGRGKAFVIGDDHFVQELSAAGIETTDNPSDIDVVLVAHDPGFNFDKLTTAYRAMTENRAQLVAASMRRRRMLPDGTYEPGPSAIVSAIETATRLNLSRNLGSPEQDLMREIFSDLSIEPEDALLVTDSLSGDVRMAKRFGVPTALVLTGESTLAQAQELKKKDQPNFILESAADIIPPYILDQL